VSRSKHSATYDIASTAEVTENPTKETFVSERKASSGNVEKRFLIFFYDYIKKK